MTTHSEMETRTAEEAVVTDTESDSHEMDPRNASNKKGLDELDIPDHFICPLTLEIYRDPVMSRRGLTFEREAIIEWLDQGNDTCPLTREPLGYRGLVPNAKLRLDVEEWKRTRGIEVKPWKCRRDLRSRTFQFMMQKSPTFVYIEDDVDDGDRNMSPSTNSLDNDSPRDRLPENHGSLPNSNEQRQRLRRFRRRRLTEHSTGFSPSTQRQRFVALIGEALSTTRRPPLVES